MSRLPAGAANVKFMSPVEWKPAFIIPSVQFRDIVMMRYDKSCKDLPVKSFKNIRICLLSTTNGSLL